MISVTSLLILIALVITLLNGLAVPPRQPPLWIAVLFLCIALLVGVFVR